jgi:ATP-binding cassette subfamily F protein 3
MGLIDVMDVRKEYSGDLLFEHVSFSGNVGDKIALIGNNGTGKTTLVKMILGQETYESGSISIANKTTIGYLSQVMIRSFEHSLYEELLDAFQEVIQLETNLKEASQMLAVNPNDPLLLKKYGDLEHRFSAAGGYDYPHRLDTIIHQFGFTRMDYNRLIKTFSGGERNKIAFSKLLLQQPDVLILDEPTNHLDMSTIEWLEEYLRTYPGAILLISHDRYFIDAVCDSIVELAFHTGERFSGNYSYYLNEKVLRYEQRLKAFQLQEREIAHLEELIRKFKPKPSKVSFAKDREKKLARIQANRIEKPKMSSKGVHWTIRADITHRVRQFTLVNLSFGHSTQPLCCPINLAVSAGDKIAIIGPNGIGKTTLLKTIANMMNPLSGEMIRHRDLKVGYIDQNLIQIDSESTLFDYVHDLYPMMSNFEVRRQLGGFLFTEEDVFKRVNQLSGGEKVRLSFAILMLKKYDILLLDEPTNHLDIETRKVLESSLRDFEGTILFVSHDRYFIDELATRIVELSEHSVVVFDGDYEHYQKEHASIVPQILAPLSSSNAKKETTKPSLRNAIKDHENRLEKLEAKMEMLHEEMLMPSTTQDYRVMQRLEAELQELEEEWNRCSEQYMNLIHQEQSLSS